jgi:hypothetical protein
MTVDRVLEFSSAKMAEDLAEKCPYLWRLMQLLLNACAACSAVVHLESYGDYLTEVIPTHVNNPQTGNQSGRNEGEGMAEQV